MTMLWGKKLAKSIFSDCSIPKVPEHAVSDFKESATTVGTGPNKMPCELIESVNFRKLDQSLSAWEQRSSKVAVAAGMKTLDFSSVVGYAILTTFLLFSPKFYLSLVEGIRREVLVSFQNVSKEVFPNAVKELFSFIKGGKQLLGKFTPATVAPPILQARTYKYINNFVLYLLILFPCWWGVISFNLT